MIQLAQGARCIWDDGTYGKIDTGRSKKLDGCRNSSARLEVHLKVNLHATEVDLDGGVDQELVGDLDGDVAREARLGESKAECDFLLDTGEGWRGDTEFRNKSASVYG